jgi:pyruvate formate lyase activating enzyme
VVPGFNADPASIGGIAKRVAELKRVLRLELLPYHNYGLAKYSRLGCEYRLTDTKPPTAELMEELAVAARAFGVEVQIGG